METVVEKKRRIARDCLLTVFVGKFTVEEQLIPITHLSIYVT
jgi:hypothetical protein